MAVYLRTLSVQITEDKIAVPERPRITLTTEESQLEEIITKGRDFKAYPEKFGPIKLGTRDRHVKRETFEDEEWLYLSTNEVAGNTMKCVWCSLAHLISSNKYKDWSFGWIFPPGVGKILKKLRKHLLILTVIIQKLHTCSILSQNNP